MIRLTTTEPAAAQQDLKTVLDGCVINTAIQPERPPTILSIRERHATSSENRRVLSLGNFSAIKGKKKSRKTYFISMICGYLLRPAGTYGRIVNDLPKEKRLCLYFDTEQGEHDSWNVMKRIEKLAGHNKHFMGFNLRPYDPLTRCELIEYALKEYGKNVGFVIIDGIRDLVVSINDEPEATRVVTLLLKWTKEYNCHISVVIHENKATGDSRGHIGTEVENKSEIVITVSQIKGRLSSEVTCDYSRSLPFETFILSIDQEWLPYIEDISGDRDVEQVSNYYEGHVRNFDAEVDVSTLPMPEQTTDENPF